MRDETFTGIAQKMPTGSQTFDALLEGGLSTCCVSDVYGAAGTGKTQFAFQNAMLVAKRSLSEYGGSKPAVAFVDCAGSFRPERIAEMAEENNDAGARFGTRDILSRISSIYVRSVAEQQELCDLVLSSNGFSECKLLIVDDVTTNFVAEFSRTEREKRDSAAAEPLGAQDTPDFVGRHYVLARYGRKLAHIALKKKMSVLLTNSIRSRISDEPTSSRSQEVETTGEVLSQFSLFRIHFSRSGNTRIALLESPVLSSTKHAEFRIESRGIVP